MGSRSRIPIAVEADILAQSRRRCCICFALDQDCSEKRGQIAHLDRDPSNNDPDNLAFLCLDHHDQYDSRTSQTKNLTIREVKQYRSELYGEVTARIHLILANSTVLDPLAPMSELPKGLLLASDLAPFVSSLKAFVLADQIPESGGWPISQERVFRYVWGQPPTKIDKREGGIVSTYIAVRGLRTAGVEMNSYSEPGRSAAKYLLKRRTAHGAFGRFTASRSGEEIHPSFRHTALACLALMMLDGPPEHIIQSVHHLETMTTEDLQDDAGPSMAIGAVLLALECATTPAWGTKHLSASTVERFQAFLADKKAELLLALDSEAKSPTTEYSPLWEPYGHSQRMLYDSSLTTLDLLTLLSDPPWDTIIAALAHIAAGQVQGALPYDPSSKTGDVGISTYFAVLCRRQRVSTQLQQTSEGRTILATADKCLEFSLRNWAKEPHTRKTYCDTIANGLLLNVSADANLPQTAC